MLNRHLLAMLFSFALIAPPAFASKLGPEHPTHIVTFDDSVVEREDDGEVEEDERHQKHPEMWLEQSHKMKIMLQRLEKKHGFKATHIYSWASHGFAANLSEKQVRDIEKISSARIAENTMQAPLALWNDQTVSGQTISWGNFSIAAPIRSAVSPYIRVYVLDSGVELNPDLNVTARMSASDGSLNDCTGHGSQIANIIGAKNNTSGVLGVAPGAPIISIKITSGCDRNPTDANAMRGIDMAVANEVKIFKGCKDGVTGITCLFLNARYGAAVLNYSFGNLINSQTLTSATALKNAFLNAAKKTDYKIDLLTGNIAGPFSAFTEPVKTKGIFSAIAVGEKTLPTDPIFGACVTYPGAFGRDIPGVMSVGSIDNTGINSSFSYYGSCVETWAPGRGIATYWGVTRYTLSGTSYAAPFVAGVAALVSQKYLNLLPAAIEATIQSNRLLTGYNTYDGLPIYIPQAGSY